MIASDAVVYAIVLLGSFAGICAILSLRVLMRNRSVRKFVRSMKQRSESAEERGAVWLQETTPEKQGAMPKKTAAKLQEMHSLMRRAEKAEAQKKFDEAEKFYIQALTTVPGAHEVQAQLARLYLQTGKEQKAIAIYIQVLQEKQDVSYFANLGLAYYRVGHFADACKAYECALEKDPNNPERVASLGRAYMADCRYPEAVAQLEKAVTRLARDTDLLNALAECYLQMQDSENARSAYQKINKLEPYNEEVKQKLGELAAA